MAAGSPVEYLPFVEWREVRLPSWSRDGDRFFVVRVCGDSLLHNAPVPLLDGDYALVHLNAEVRNGDLAAVRTPEGVMLKFVHYEGDGILRLESANPNYPPRRFEASDVEIQGRVVRTEHDW